MKHFRRIAAVLSLAASVFDGVALAAESGGAGSLPKLRVDPARVAVAGISAGAYMAGQAQIAYPELFRGAALIAGGPYDCAQGNLAAAVTMCMKGAPAPDVAALVKLAQTRSAKGEVGPLEKLAGGKVYVLHGRQDPVIAEAVARAAADFYEALKASLPTLSTLTVTWDGSRDFSHTFPTDAAGSACGKVAAPFIGHCGFDAAGAVFRALYGTPVHEPGKVRGDLLEFDQNALRPDGADAYLADKGMLYVPPACAKGARCGVLVALHGCQQNLDAVGDAFVREAGFNRWADVYGIVVLYPQVRSGVVANPKSCWDWFGYSGSGYATREGVQLRWLRNALTALGRDLR